MLERPILLITSTTASVQMRLYMLADAGTPHGRHYVVLRRHGGFWYLPSVRGQWAEIPRDTLIMAYHGWHYTAVASVGGASGRTGQSTEARATTPCEAGYPGGREEGRPHTVQEVPRDRAADMLYGRANFGNTCTINALAQAFLCPIIEDFGRGLEHWDPDRTTLCNSLVGASTARGPEGMARASAALRAAMEDGGREQLHMVIGNVGADPGPQLDMEEMMERSLTMIRQEHPGTMRSIDWHIACQGLCRNEECARYGRVVTTIVSCNPVVLQPCPT